ncbi:MAG: hypothetical protein PVG33_07045, partial [Chloroflexota bacterium]
MNGRVATLLLLTIAFVLAVGAALAVGLPTDSPDPAAEQPDPNWYFEEIDVPGAYWGMGDRSLRVSDAGVPHLVYGASHLYLARFQDGSWTSEVVDDGVSVGEGASLALDGNGYPHIAYKDTLKMKLKYAAWDGQQWQVQSLADVVDTNLLGTAIDLDATDRPHILYSGDEDGKPGLYYTFWDGVAWQTIMLKQGQAAGPSIVVDDSGGAHISYADFNHARYGRLVAGAWQFEDVGPVGYDYGTSLALDSAGQPHVAYLASDWDYNTDVIYAIRQAGVWTTTTAMEDTNNVGVSLVLDDDDLPHIANGKSYLTLDGGVWQQEPVVGLNGSYFESIALNPAGRPIISAVAGGRVVECAHHDGASWTVHELARGATGGLGSAVAANSDQEPRVVYLDDQADQLMYAARQDGGWSTSVITIAWSNFSADLVIDDTDRPHLCLGRGVEVRYGHQDGDQWTFETVGGWDGGCQVALDSTGRAHMAYIGQGQVRYAARAAEGWDVHGLGGQDEMVSMALDKTDRPHLVYFDISDDPDHEYALMHTVLTGSGWITDVVDSGAWVNAASLIIDENDDMHIAYFYKQDECQLRYATWRDAKWQIETVAEGMCLGQSVDIGLGAAGRPLIVMRDDYYRLSYACQDGAGWR